MLLIKSKLERFLMPFSWWERIILFMSVISILTCFLTWFVQVDVSLGLDYKVQTNYNAFLWIWAVLGYFYFIFAVIQFLLLCFKTNRQIESFVSHNRWIFLFLTGEALFVSVCALLIYSAYAFSSPFSRIWFGLYLSIISMVIGLFGSHYYFISKKK